MLEDFPLYRIYEDGTLISYVRNNPYKIRWGLDKQGYLKTKIFDYDKNRKKVSQHRMLAMAFVPNTENKNTVNHINGIKDDNRLENLEWLTQKENDRHSRDILGNDWVGEKHPVSHYSNEEIKQVIDKLNEGLTFPAPSRRFPGTIFHRPPRPRLRRARCGIRMGPRTGDQRRGIRNGSRHDRRSAKRRCSADHRGDRTAAAVGPSAVRSPGSAGAHLFRLGTRQ